MAKELKVSLEPYIIALSGNPIQIVVEINDEDNPVSYCPVLYNLTVDDKIIYEGRVITDSTGHVSIQISDLLVDVIKKPELSSDEVDIGSMPELVNNYSVTISSDGCEPVEISNHKIIYGKINERMLDYLSRIGCNIFTYKFLNGCGNFTTSTRNLYYKSELLPIMGIGNGESCTIYYNGVQLKILTDYLNPYIINLNNIHNNSGKATIVLGENYGFYIDIIDDPNFTGMCFEFRNSFGIFEKLLTTGKYSLSIDSNKESIPTSFIVGTSQQIPAKIEPQYTISWSVNTGYINPRRIPGLLAMLASGEVYSIRDGIRERVTVACSESIPANVDTPMSFSLTVKSVGNDQGYIPDLNQEDHGYPTLHNSNYNNKYN